MKRYLFMALFLIMMAFGSVSATSVVSLWEIGYMKLDDGELGEVKDGIFATLSVDANKVYFIVMEKDADESIGFYLVTDMKKGKPVHLENGTMQDVELTVLDVDDDYEKYDLSISYRNDLVFIYLKHQGETVLFASPNFPSFSNTNLEKLLRVYNDRPKNRTIESYF